MKEDKRKLTLTPSLPALKHTTPLFDEGFVCPFCNDESKYIKDILKDEIEHHLIVTKDLSGHYHVHGAIHNNVLMKEFIKVIAKESGLEIED